MFGTQRMSINHWRYRALYWAFTVEQGTPPEKSGLPSFMFSHYCPLFHTTNFIVLLSPLILALKTLRACGKVFVDKVLEPLLDLIYDKMHERAEQPENRWKECKACIIRDMTKGSGYVYKAETYANIYDQDVEKVQAFIDQTKAAIKASKERKEAAQKARYDKMVMWANLGKVVVGWLIYASYAVAAAVSVYLVCIGFWPFINLIKWIFSADYSWVLTAMGIAAKLAILLLALFMVSYTLLKLGVFEQTAKVKNILPSFGLVGKVVTAPWRGIKTAFNNVCEFISVFYSTNCPPIEIVSDDVGEIEEAING